MVPRRWGAHNAMPGTSRRRVLVEVAEDLRPGLAAEQRHRRSRRDVDEPAERQHDPDDDTGQHAGRRARRRSPPPRSRSRSAPRGAGGAAPATSIMPNTTASMITAPEHGLGQLREQRARTSSVADAPARRSRARRPACALPRSRSASWPRGSSRPASPGTRPAPTFAIPCADRLLVDVDAVAVPRGEGPRVAGGLGEPDQQQRDGGDGDDPEYGRSTSSASGQLGRGQSARHVADERDAVCAEVEQRRREQAARDEHERAGHAPAPADAGRGSRASAAAPTSTVVQCIVVERAQPRRELAPRAVPSADVPVSFGSSPMTTSTAAPGQEARDHRLREEARDPAHPQQREQQEQHARSPARSPRPAAPPPRPARPVTTTAPPATAASDELGPVEMCRDVQKSA